MARRLKPIEKLAREICWAEFGNPKPKGYTKAAYWRSICHESREQLIKEAGRVCWILWNTAGISDNLLNDAMRAYESERARGGK